MKRPEPPQDFEKTIQRVNIATPAQTQTKTPAQCKPTNAHPLFCNFHLISPFFLIVQLKTQKAAQKKPASAPLDMALHERNKEVAHSLATEMPLNNYTKHP